MFQVYMFVFMWMNVFARICAFVRAYMLQIDSDGHVQKPIIHFWNDLAPMYR